MEKSGKGLSLTEDELSSLLSSEDELSVLSSNEEALSCEEELPKKLERTPSRSASQPLAVDKRVTQDKIVSTALVNFFIREHYNIGEMESQTIVGANCG